MINTYDLNTGNKPSALRLSIKSAFQIKTREDIEK